MYLYVQMCMSTKVYLSLYMDGCVCVCVCLLTHSITYCGLVGETVRIQADYRGEIRSLHHTDPVFYSRKTGGYLSEQDEKVPCFVSYKEVDGQRVHEWVGLAEMKCYCSIQ